MLIFESAIKGVLAFTLSILNRRGSSHTSISGTADASGFGHGLINPECPVAASNDRRSDRRA
jgi:hypothetical protein